MMPINAAEPERVNMTSTVRDRCAGVIGADCQPVYRPAVPVCLDRRGYGRTVTRVPFDGTGRGESVLSSTR